MLKINKYLNKCTEEIAGILIRNPRSMKAEDYHKIRISIKKIKALFELIEFCNDKFPAKKHFKAFKPLFKQAGEIRDNYIQQSLIKKYAIPQTNEYLSELNKSAKAEKQAFGQFAGNTEADKLKKEAFELEEIILDLKKKDIAKYFRKTAEKIENALRKNHMREKKLHLLRMKLKSYYYNLKIMNEEKTLIPIIKDLEELLGKWHDLKLTSGQLRLALDAQVADKIESARLVLIRNKLLKEKKSCLEKISARMDDLKLA